MSDCPWQSLRVCTIAFETFRRMGNWGGNICGWAENWRMTAARRILERRRSSVSVSPWQSSAATRLACRAQCRSQPYQTDFDFWYLNLNFVIIYRLIFSTHCFYTLVLSCSWTISLMAICSTNSRITSHNCIVYFAIYCFCLLCIIIGIV